MAEQLGVLTGQLIDHQLGFRELSLRPAYRLEGEIFVRVGVIADFVAAADDLCEQVLVVLGV
ncbi:MAG TPA: hypothetical protein VFR46_12135, partial [Actinomycetes bacterium]|nr:hypothetical protein [Actinomycetes bacterium]